MDYGAHEQLGDVEAVDCELLEECPAGVVRVEAAHMGTLSSGPLVGFLGCPGQHQSHAFLILTHLHCFLIPVH